jgi:hypothetical protein
MTRAVATAMVAALTIAIGCDEKPTSPDTTTSSTTSTTSTTTSLSSVVFEGVLTMNGSAFYSFTAAQAGVVSATLSSLVLVGHRDAFTAPVRIGVGTPKGEGCALTQSMDAAPALVTQLTAPLTTTGIYCVSITDVGTLTGDALFSIRFSHP